MRIKYDKTNWINNETPVNADNMNKIETAIENLYNLALSPSDFSTNSQIKPTITDGNISLDFNGIVLREVEEKPKSPYSHGIPGDFYLDLERINLIYICFKPNFWLCINGVLFDNTENEEDDIDTTTDITNDIGE